MTILLNGKNMTDRSTVHSYLAEKLGMPAFYGRNLDALFDVLTEIGTDTQILLEDATCVAENLGQYGEALLATMQEAAQENSHLMLTLK